MRTSITLDDEVFQELLEITNEPNASGADGGRTLRAGRQAQAVA